MTRLYRSTGHALRGMTLGDVDRDWARRHHPKWVEAEERSATAPVEETSSARDSVAAQIGGSDAPRS